MAPPDALRCAMTFLPSAFRPKPAFRTGQTLTAIDEFAGHFAVSEIIQILIRQLRCLDHSVCGLSAAGATEAGFRLAMRLQA